MLCTAEVAVPSLEARKCKKKYDRRPQRRKVKERSVLWEEWKTFSHICKHVMPELHTKTAEK